MQAITEVLKKSHYGNSHLQMRQNPITIAEHSGLWLISVLMRALVFIVAFKHFGIALLKEDSHNSREPKNAKCNSNCIKLHYNYVDRYLQFTSGFFTLR